MKTWTKYTLVILTLGFSSMLFGQNFTQTAVTGIDIGGNKDGGAVWADFDNDGDLDLLVNTDDGTIDTRLLQSNGADPPVFSDVTATLAAGLLNNNTERSILWGDLNNDGNMDFVRNAHSRIEFYINRGSGSTPDPYMFGVGTGETPNLVFTDLDVNGNNCGGGNDGINSEGLAFLDYNNDGWLDLVIENADCGVDILENQQLDGTATRGIQLGDGGDNDGVVENSAEALGNDFMQQLNNYPALGLAIDGGNGDYMAAGDYNADGYVDFIVRKPSNGTAPYGTKLYTNDGDDTFTANTSIPTNAASTDADNANKGGVIFCDFDLDGDLDIYWTDSGTNQIWLQTTSGNFVASAKPTIPGSPDIDGCACADVDGDGDIDLFLGNNAGNSYVYINTTTDINSVADLSFTRTDLAVNANAEGVNLVDYDDDGDYDLYINVDAAANQLWENDLCQNTTCNYLKVFTEDCVDGTTVTRPIVGASLIIRDDMGNIVSGAQTGSTAAGHGAQNPPVSIFHLPDMTSDYTIDITFPEKNGTIETYSYDFNAGDISNNTLTLTALNGTNGSSCDFSVLPVEMISFGLEKRTDRIHINWTTATELNNDYFEVQHSSDGAGFMTIGTVKGNGTTDERHDYAFVDSSPFVGANYYRLKQVDYDGTEEIFKTKVAFFEVEDDLTVFPNPASEEITIYLGKRFSRTNSNIQLIDISGKIIWQKTLKTPEVLVNSRFSTLEQGIYFVKISNEQYTSTRRVKLGY